jgi:hypothetical protein
MAIESLLKSKVYLQIHGDVLLQEKAWSYHLRLAFLEDEMNGLHEKM